LLSLSVDVHGSTFSTERVRSTELQQAYDHVSAIGEALPAEDSEVDVRLDEVRQASSDLFFLMASLLEGPDRDDLTRLNRNIAVLKNHQRHVERCLGGAIAERVCKLADCGTTFVAGLRDGRKTLKGEALLSFTRRVSPHTHAFVSDFGRDRERLAQFLE